MNYDTNALLKTCLESLRRFPPLCDYEILVVNNGSRKDSSEDLQREHPDCSVLHLPVNQGFGRANNFGMQHARGRFLLLLNSDTYFTDDAISRALRFAETHPEVDLLGFQLLNPDGSEQVSITGVRPDSRILEVLEYYARSLVRTKSANRLFPQPPASEGRHLEYRLSGCCVLLKREVFWETGGFDPDFYLYGEDLEWFGHRIHASRFRAEFHPEFQVVHHLMGSDVSGGAVEQCRMSDLLYFYKLGYLPYLFAIAGMVASTGLRLLLYPFLKEPRAVNRTLLKATPELLYRALFDIPRYPRAFGSRPEFLISSHFRARLKPHPQA